MPGGLMGLMSVADMMASPNFVRASQAGQAAKPGGLDMDDFSRKYGGIWDEYSSEMSGDRVSTWAQGLKAAGVTQPEAVVNDWFSKYGSYWRPGETPNFKYTPPTPAVPAQGVQWPPPGMQAMLGRYMPQGNYRIAPYQSAVPQGAPAAPQGGFGGFAAPAPSAVPAGLGGAGAAPSAPAGPLNGSGQVIRFGGFGVPYYG